MCVLKINSARFKIQTCNKSSDSQVQVRVEVHLKWAFASPSPSRSRSPVGKNEPARISAYSVLYFLLLLTKSPTSKLIHTMLHFKNTNFLPRSLSHFLLCLGVARCLYGWRPFPPVHLKPEYQIYGLSHSHHPSHINIWPKAPLLEHQSQCQLCHWGVLRCACSLRTTSTSLLVVLWSDLITF